jgi:hypothetical protein
MFTITDTNYILRATVTSDGRITVTNRTIAYVNLDGSAGDKYVSQYTVFNYR